MDPAVALVQSYLHVNGYFTVTEYPVLEAFDSTQVRTVTDLDILAFRFERPRADSLERDGRRRDDDPALRPDPALGAPLTGSDMIVGEVKEGSARFNPAMRDPAVLEAALARFGCCPADDAAELTGQLLRRGHAQTPAGHTIRMVAFGSAVDGQQHGRWTTVPMHHVVEYLQEYLRDHWSVLRHAQLRDSTLALLALLEKWQVQGAPR